ncbi:hypothetical protein FYK55_00005 [Roseiconus nitratireducens]|uniref:Uncharacterized protein n=1 Tax=Roseiconus nitratireducens TaxID=2605748 RepID=A0A5M6DHC9_9BACT|nr:hypothetical protein [Roseiconus nitratireducens]KAA5546853.1 hypothetical protein FYK55_00005 [Roseiconus nitratireducens]
MKGLTLSDNPYRPTDHTQDLDSDPAHDGDPIPLTGVTIGAFLVAIFLCVFTGLIIEPSGIDAANIYAAYGGAVFFAVSMVGAFLFNAWHRRRSD